MFSPFSLFIFSFIFSLLFSFIFSLLLSCFFSLLFTHRNGNNQTSDSINGERPCTTIHSVKRELSICQSLLAELTRQTTLRPTAPRRNDRQTTHDRQGLETNVLSVNKFRLTQQPSADRHLKTYINCCTISCNISCKTHFLSRLGRYPLEASFF